MAVHKLRKALNTQLEQPHFVRHDCVQDNNVDSGVFVVVFLNLLYRGIPPTNWSGYCSQARMNALRKEFALALLDKRVMNILYEKP